MKVSLVCSRTKTPVQTELATYGYVAFCPELDEDLLGIEIEFSLHGDTYIPYHLGVKTLHDNGYRIVQQNNGKYSCHDKDGLFAMDLPNIPDAHLICMQKALN